MYATCVGLVIMGINEINKEEQRDILLEEKEPVNQKPPTIKPPTEKRSGFFQNIINKGKAWLEEENNDKMI